MEEYHRRRKDPVNDIVRVLTATPQQLEHRDQ